uniref:Kinectin Kinesin receptor CG 1 antigen n=1 Tax=Echinococcus granulosus TaxID=6210 RepID=A0A068X1R7_ECHGR|nr:Kinectin Kinesin receptor CG 1 antigen [Echinococcus granulosus]
MALRHRLHAVMTVAPDREKLEKELVGELEKAKREMEEMHERVMKMENEKSEEYEKLEQIVSKLEALRQHQAKRIAGLQSKTQRQSTLEAQKDQQLSAAKNFLIENRQKQLRLLNFRNTLGRILGLDAWLTPNPEALIIQRVQQILLNASAPSRTLFLTQPFAPFSLPQPTFAAPQLPALPGPSHELQEDGVTGVQNSPTQSGKVNLKNPKTDLNVVACAYGLFKVKRVEVAGSGAMRFLASLENAC